MRLLRAGAPDAVERARRRVEATLTAIERVLGLRVGDLDRVGARILERFQKKPGPESAGAGTRKPRRTP